MDQFQSSFGEFACGCPACSGVQEENSSSSETQYEIQYDLDPSNPDSDLVGTNGDNGKPIWSAYQTAAHIARSGSTWADDGDDPGTTTVVTYRFANETLTGNADHVFEAVNQDFTRDYLLKQYSDVADVEFQEVTAEADGSWASGANITFQYRDGSNGGGYWNGSKVVVSRVSWEPEMEAGTYNARLMLHEIGHGMGLSHPGPYNGGGYNYADDADHWNDSRQYSNMSYWGEGETGGSFGNMSTLALHDILAIQIEYGINWGTRDGNTTYGYNANAGDEYDFTTTRTNGSGNEIANTDMAFSIWDGGGNDTLDFSGSTSSTELDLRDGYFSSVNGQTYNVSIAYGAVIENGVGSAFADTITGNQVSNVLIGGAGDDVIRGGLDAAPDFTPDARHFTGMQINEDPNIFDQYLSISDIASFSGSAFTIEMMVDIARMSSNDTMLVSYASGSSADSFVIWGDNAGTIKVEITNSSIDTGIATETLIDGLPHRVSVSWDQVNGALDFYIDGVSAFSGTHQAGVNIGSGGTLIFGQEQDSVGGNFATNQTFQGTIGDIRIFDDVRTAGEIDANKFGTVAINEDGLLLNWQVQAGDTTSITDAVPHTPPASIDITTIFRDQFSASQSSTWSDSSSYAADRVLDDNTGSISHTGQNQYIDQWLQIDFAQGFDITEIVLTNRDGWGDRLDGCVVSVLDVNGTVIHAFDPIAGATNGEVFNLVLPSAMVAHAVRVDNDDEDHLQIAEIDIMGPVPVGVDLAALTVHNGATVFDTTPVVNTASDDDTLTGGYGRDTLYGGWGDDNLIGDGGNMRASGSIDLVHLNESFDAATMGGGYNDHSLDQPESFAMPTTAVTMEMLIRLDSSPSSYDTIFAYSSGGEWSGMDFALRGTNNGADYSFWIAGQEYRSVFSRDTFTSDTPIRLSISWDSATGETNVFLDGALVATSEIATGETLLGNGNLWFMSGWDATIHGAIGDIRVWDHVRTAEEISDNAWIELDDPANEAGLVANWQVDPANLVTLTEAAGSASDMTVQNIIAENPVVLETVDFTAQFNDILNGGLGNDTLNGGDGDDILNGGLGTDQLDGGAGTDTASYATAASAVVVSLADMTTNTGEAAGDTYTSIENIIGSAFADTLTGDAGVNVISGGTGDDSLHGGGGGDQFAGGAGTDTVTLSGIAGDYTVNDQGGGVFTVVDDNIGDGDDGLNTFDSVETIIFADESIAASDYIDDAPTSVEVTTVVASIDENFNTSNGIYIADIAVTDLDGGNHVLSLVDADATSFELRNDTQLYFIGASPDWELQSAYSVAVAADYTSVLTTLDVASTIYTLTINNTIDGLTLTGTPGADTLTGDYEEDTLTGLADDDTLIGLGGADVLDGHTGADMMYGGAGDDTFYIDADDIVIDGGTGYDSVYVRGYSAGVTIDMTASAIEFASGNAQDDIFDATGSAVDVRLYGLGGNDTLTGGAGGDIIRGQGGTDELFGDDGDDTIYIDADDTSVDGGAGYDRVFVETYSSSVSLDLALSSIEYAKGANWHDSFDATNVTELVKLWGNGRDDILTGSAFNDYLNGGSGNDTVTGNDGNDVIDGHTGIDILSGGAGDDLFHIDADDTTIDGGDGYDRIYVRGYTDGVDVDMAAGNLEFANGNWRDDTFDATGSTVSVKILGQSGNDTITGGEVGDLLYGGLGNDIISGGAGDDFINGLNGTDTLAGGDGVDRLRGHTESDILNGGAGDDYLWGGTEADIFVFDAGWGLDRLADWEDGLDSIDMSSLGITFGDLIISQAGNHTDIDYGTDTIRVLNTVVADFDASDFAFV